MAEAGGPMNLMPACSQDSAKAGIFGEESVAGVDGVGAGAARNVQEEVAAEVGFGGGRGTEAVGFVGGEDVETGAVGVRDRRRRWGGLARDRRG